MDADPQGSLTLSLGFPTPDKLPITLATVMGKTLMDEPVPSKEGICIMRRGEPLMPANIELSGLEVSLERHVAGKDSQTISGHRKT